MADHTTPALHDEEASSGGQAAAAHADHDHSPFLAHHFETPQQQFDAGKLGMWLFLVTEILFFGGLFVAYAVYRANHPEVFLYAHQFLDKTLGALNTVVLLFSSLTMAWAVRSAQLNQRRQLIVCLAMTLACAAFFLGVKAVEYSTKWQEGLLWARDFQPHFDHTPAAQKQLGMKLTTLCLPALLVLAASTVWWLVSLARRRASARLLSGILTIAGIAFFAGTGLGLAIPHWQRTFRADAAAHDNVAPSDTAAASQAPVAETPSPAAAAPTGSESTATQGHAATTATSPTVHAADTPRLAGVFFSIYFAMTGVHALHIIGGMAVIAWLVHRAIGGEFGPHYFNPVDFVGLYWHLVDLVWIYLFPLLYLIH